MHATCQSRCENTKLDRESAVILLLELLLMTFLDCAMLIYHRELQLKLLKFRGDCRISKSATVIYFTRRLMHFAGDRSSLPMTIKIAKSDIEDLEKECLKSGFKTLTAANLIESGFAQMHKPSICLPTWPHTAGTQFG
jgi:hypothetical protein